MLTKLIKNSIFSFIFIFLLFFGINKVSAVSLSYNPLTTTTSFIENNPDNFLLLDMTYSSTTHFKVYLSNDRDTLFLYNDLRKNDSYVIPLDDLISENNLDFDLTNINLGIASHPSSIYDIVLFISNGQLPKWHFSGSTPYLDYYSNTLRVSYIFGGSDYIPYVSYLTNSDINQYGYWGPTSIQNGEINFTTNTQWNYLSNSIKQPTLVLPDIPVPDNGLNYDDLNSSGTIEEVEFTHNNITFTHLLKIKISDLYRSANSGYYKPYFLTYMSSISTGVESNFYITYDKTTNGKPNFPLSILFKENLGAIEKIANGSEEDPFSFEYYGNRLPECSIESSIPLSHTTYNDSPNFYNYLLIYPTWYCGYYGDTWEPTIWGNDYIYIYYNARLYNDLDTLEQDFENNPSNFEETNFFNYMVRSLDHFMGRIPSIFKLITIFFNSLPYEIRLMFIAVFTLIITLLIYKVIG